jgi:hypothetical protein
MSAFVSVLVSASPVSQAQCCRRLRPSNRRRSFRRCRETVKHSHQAMAMDLGRRQETGRDLDRRQETVMDLDRHQETATGLGRRQETATDSRQGLDRRQETVMGLSQRQVTTMATDSGQRLETVRG